MVFFPQHSDLIFLKNEINVSLQCNLRVTQFPHILGAEVLLSSVGAEVLTKHPIPTSRLLRNTSQILLDYHNIAKHGNKTAFGAMILSERKMAPYQRVVLFSGQGFCILEYFPWNYFISSVPKIQDFCLHL